MTEKKKLHGKTPMPYADIQEFRDMQTVVISHSKLLEKMDSRVGLLEDDKKAETIAKKAVQKYQDEEERKRQRDDTKRETKVRTEVLVRLAYILALLGVALYAYLASKGVTK